MRFAKQLIGAGILLAAVALAYTIGNVRGHSQNTDAVVFAWQQAFAHLSDKAENCIDPKEVNAILEQYVSDWPTLTTAESAVIFADWRGQVRGQVLKQYLRFAGTEPTTEYVD